VERPLESSREKMTRPGVVVRNSTRSSGTGSDPAGRSRAATRRGTRPSFPSDWKRFRPFWPSDFASCSGGNAEIVLAVGEVVRAEHHVLCRRRERAAPCAGREDVCSTTASVSDTPPVPPQRAAGGRPSGRRRRSRVERVADEADEPGSPCPRRATGSNALDAEAVQRRSAVSGEPDAPRSPLRARPRPREPIDSTCFSFAALMFWTAFRSTSRLMMNGLNSSSAISFGRPHWYSFRLGPENNHRAARVVDALAPAGFWAEAALLALEHGRRATSSGRLPGPVTATTRDDRCRTARRRPPAASAFSLLTMISGAPQVEQPPFSRLFRLITRAVEGRSGRSSQTGPPSSCTHRAKLRRNHRHGPRAPSTPACSPTS